VDLDVIWELLLPAMAVLLSGPPLEGAARDVLRDSPDVSAAAAGLPAWLAPAVCWLCCRACASDGGPARHPAAATSARSLNK
jgi:hypothetical protein